MSEPSISIGTIQGGQNNIGHTEIKGNQVQNVGPQPEATVEKFFELLRSALPGGEEPGADEARAAIDELETKARSGEPIPENTSTETEVSAEQQPQDMFSRIMGPYIKPLAPYGPAISRAVLAFGDDFFSSVAQKNSWVSATLKAIKAFNAA